MQGGGRESTFICSCETHGAVQTDKEMKHSWENIGCSDKNCRGFPLNTPTMDHIETQTRYHLIEVNLFYILVNDFFFH